jgi:NADPH2:quinone reductase
VQGGVKSTINLLKIMTKRLRIMGSTLRNRSENEKAALAREVETNIWPLVETGQMKAVIDSTYPLHDAEHAHSRLLSGHHFGKIVLTQ